MRGALPCAALAASLLASASPAGAAETEGGLFTAIFAGTHIGSDNPVPVHGIVPGALLEVTGTAGRGALRLEGIPEVSAAGSGTGPFGRSKASLQLLNTYATYQVDPARLVRIGVGTQLINLTNANGGNGDVNQARILAPLMHADATLPLPGDRAIELGINVVPNIRTDLHVFRSTGQAALDKPEGGAEEDVSLDVRWRRGPLVYRAGLRGIDYSTRNTRTGEEVDRNTGGGVTFDVRYAFGRR